jgi:AcrR family transcriptional regulator
MAKNVPKTADALPPKRKPGRPRLLEPSQEYITRRADIIAAAAQVFREKGYDAGTLDDVADVLDLRRASLYYYVKSKANLLFMIFEHALDVYYSDLQEILHIEDPTDRLEGLIRWHVIHAANDPAIFSVIFDYRHRLEPQYQELIRSREVEYLGALHQAVEAACEAGSIRVEDSEYAARLIFGMANWTYKWFQVDRDDPEKLADACVSLILKPKRTRRRTSAGSPRRRATSGK